MLNKCKCFICEKTANKVLDIESEKSCEYKFIKIHLCNKHYKDMKNRSNEEIKQKYFI